MGLWFGNPVSYDCLLFFLQNMQFVLFLMCNLAIFPFFFLSLNINHESVVFFFFLQLSLCPSTIWVDEIHKLPWNFLKRSQICCIKKGFSQFIFHLYMMLIPFKISLSPSCSSSPDTMIMKLIYDLWPSPQDKKDTIITADVLFQCVFIFVRKQILAWIPSVWLQRRLGSLRTFGISIFSSWSFFSSCFTYDLLFLIFLLQSTVLWWGLDRAKTKKKNGIKGKSIAAFLF